MTIMLITLDCYVIPFSRNLHNLPAFSNLILIQKNYNRAVKRLKDIVIIFKLPSSVRHWKTLERGGHNLEPLLRPKPGKVFKIGLPLSDKSLSRISQLSIFQYLAPD